MSLQVKMQCVCTVIWTALSNSETPIQKITLLATYTKLLINLCCCKRSTEKDARKAYKMLPDFCSCVISNRISVVCTIFFFPQLLLKLCMYERSHLKMMWMRSSPMYCSWHLRNNMTGKFQASQHVNFAFIYFFSTDWKVLVLIYSVTLTDKVQCPKTTQGMWGMP